MRRTHIYLALPIALMTAITCRSAAAEMPRTAQTSNTLSAISFSPNAVSIQLSEQCMLGDFDAIRHDMIYAGVPRLLLSVEAIDSGAEETRLVYSKLDNLPQPKTEDERTDQQRTIDQYLRTVFTRGEVAELNFPPTEVGYIIRLCKDSTQTSSCANKPLTKISELIDKLSSVDSGHVSPDVVYYYQPLIIAQGSPQALESSFQESDAESIEALLLSRNPQLRKDTTNTILDALRATQSWPLSITNKNVLTIELPFYSRKKCRAGK